MIRKPSYLLLSSALSAAIVTGPAWAQEQPANNRTVIERIGALEGTIAARQAELQSYQKELASLRQSVTGEPPPMPVQAVAEHATCKMASVADYDTAFIDPRELQNCIPSLKASATQADGKPEKPLGEKASPQEASYVANRESQPLPDRPNIAPGISTTLQVSGTSTKASIGYSHPVLFRKRSQTEARDLGDRFNWVRSQLLTVSASVNVNVDNSEFKFVGFATDKEMSDVDILKGTTFRFGVDFLSFQRQYRGYAYTRMTDFLYEAMKACVKETSGATEVVKSDFYKHYGLTQNSDKPRVWDYSRVADAAVPIERLCTGNHLIQYVLAVEPDDTSERRPRLKRAALASAYQAIFWSEPETAIPRWGVGGSIEIGTNDFSYRQASVSLVPSGSDPTRVVLTPDLTQPLAASSTVSREDWKLQGYGSLFFPTLNREADRSGFYSDGVMVVGAVSYLSENKFRLGGSAVLLCPIAAGGALNVQCATTNVDRPYLLDSILVSAEFRTQFNGVPLIKSLGFAPKYTQRLTDDRKIIDVPIYLSQTGSWGSAGVRWRHAFDGLDLLGNKEAKTNELLLFFNTPLNFRGL